MAFSSFLTLVAAMLMVCMVQSFTYDPAVVEKLKQRVRDNGCKPRICFALDGSGSIFPSEWREQKEFVLLVAAIIGVDPDARFAAVQYGLSLKKISLLTRKIDEFLLDVDAAKQAKAPRTFIAAGLGFCISQFTSGRGQPSKIVLLGDGRSNFGGNPVPIARNWRNRYPGYRICAVEVGFFPKKRALRKITGSKKLVLQVDDWFKVVDILRDLVEEICELPPDF